MRPSLRSLALAALRGLAVLLGLVLEAQGQLTWSSYNTSGTRVSASAAAYDSATGNYTFTIPASTSYTFVTTSFVPVTLAASQTKTVAFTMNANGGFGAAGSPVQNQRFIAYGLFNCGATAPGATGQFTDDLGLWTDSYQQSSGIAAEVFGGTSTTANLLGYASATQLGAGTGPGSGAVGQFTNNSTTNVTFRVVEDASGTASIGTGTSTAAAGAWYADAATGGTTFNRTIYSAGATTPNGTTTFNEFGFMFYNSTGSPVTLTLGSFTGLTPVITTQPSSVLAAPGGNATFTVTAAAAGTFQWQSSSDGGATFTNIDAASNPSAATASLQLTNVQTTSPSLYRVLVTATGGAATASNSARLVVPSTANTTATPQINFAFRAPTRSGITVTGAGAIGSAGSVWNNLTGATLSTSTKSQDLLSNAALVSDSGAATSVALTLNATSPTNNISDVVKAWNDGSSFSPVSAIMNYYTYYWWNATVTLTLTGLRPGTTYDLYGYGAGNAHNQGSSWALDAANGGASANCLGDYNNGYTRDVTNAANLGHTYVKLSGTATSSGTLTVVVDNPPGQNDPHFNGFQVAETPQTTITGQPANTVTTVGASAAFAITAPTGQAFLWQRSTDAGSTWTTLNPSTNASAATTALALSNCQNSDAGLYRALVLTAQGALIVSQTATLAVVPNGGSTADTAVNVAFRANSQSGAPAVTGAAAAGSAGSVWNNLVGAAPSSSVLTQALVSGAALLDDSGAATSKTMTLTVTAGSNSVAASQHFFNDGTTYSPSSIMNYYTYWWWNAYLTVSVNGLKPNGLYYLYGYGTGNAAGQGSKWIVDAANGGASAEAPADFGSGYTRDVTNTANLNHSYVKLSATATSSGTLTFVVDNATGQNDPYVNGFQIVPQALPTITAQPPANSTATLMGTFSLGVTATGPGTLSYQWQKSTDGGATFANISGASNASAVTSTLSLTNAQASDAGTYRVLVTNASGTVISSNAVVTTSQGLVAPSIQTQPADTTVLAGATATFTVGASGTSPLGYQWQKSTNGGSTYSNVATDSSTLSITNTTLADAGLYRVMVTNSVGSITSNAATLTVNQAPVITAQPVGAVIAGGSNYTLSVTATGSPTPTYQWKFNGTNISGATSASYPITGATGAKAGYYSCVVTNAIGSVTSNSVYVGVLSATMSLDSTAPFGPANGATGRNRDTLLKITFNQPVNVGTSGRIRVYDVSTPATPVDTIDMSTAHVITTTAEASGSYMQKTIGGLIYDYQPVIASGNTATIALHSSTALAYNKTYYVNIEPGVLLDATGATFAGISDNSTWTFSTKASGPAANTASIAVAADGTGDFDTVQGAVDFIPFSPANTIARTISVKNGIYTEYVHFRSGQNLVTLKGESQNGVVIQYLVNNFVLNDLPNQNTLDPRGVFSCSTNDVTLQNLTIKNLTPNGGSQAEALVHGGQRFIVNHVSLYSYQDTLLAGGGTSFYTDSYIEGAVDYIWGGSQAFFQRCELKANTNNTYYTQARNSQTGKGFAFVNCTLDAYPTVSASTARLSRTFNDFSQTIYINCRMGPHINPAGWAINSGDPGTLQLWEYQSTDLNGVALDVSQRPTYNRAFSVSGNTIVYTAGATSSSDVFDHQQVSAAMAALFSTPSAFFGTWAPTVAPTFDTQPVATQTILAGQSATFTAAATGFPDPTYQWQKNGTPISGATSASYTIAAVASSDAATYTVVATNSAGSTTSSHAVLTVQSLLDAWKIANFGSTSNPNAADNADPDGDGVKNLLELGFGMNPNVNNAGALVVSGTTLVQHGMPTIYVDTQPTAVNYAARFVRRRDWVAAGLSYAVWFSSDLVNWEASTATFTLIAQDATHEVISVPFPPLINGKNAQFFKVVVTAQ